MRGLSECRIGSVHLLFMNRRLWSLQRNILAVNSLNLWAEPTRVSHAVNLFSLVQKYKTVYFYQTQVKGALLKSLMKYFSTCELYFWLWAFFSNIYPFFLWDRLRPHWSQAISETKVYKKVWCAIKYILSTFILSLLFFYHSFGDLKRNHGVAIISVSYHYIWAIWILLVSL